MKKINLNEQELKEELLKNQDEAKQLLEDKDKLEELLLKLEKKLKVVPKLGETLAIVPTMISLVRSYSKKEYTEIPFGTIIAIVCALIYVLSPIDLIPDDVLMIASCLKWVQDDIKEYENWRDNK